MKIEDIKIFDTYEHIVTGMKIVIISKSPGKAWYQEMQSSSIGSIDIENIKQWRRLGHA